MSSGPSADLHEPNPLARVLVEHTRELAQLRREHQALEDRLVRAVVESRKWERFARSFEDFAYWLMLRADKPVNGLVHEWHEELDRRERRRKELAA